MTHTIIPMEQAQPCAGNNHCSMPATHLLENTCYCAAHCTDHAEEGRDMLVQWCQDQLTLLEQQAEGIRAEYEHLLHQQAEAYRQWRGGELLAALQHLRDEQKRLTAALQRNTSNVILLLISCGSGLPPLNVTVYERQRYPLSVLFALDALRTAGLLAPGVNCYPMEPMPVEGREGLFYHVLGPDDRIHHFASPAEIIAFAAQYMAGHQSQCESNGLTNARMDDWYKNS